MSPLSPMRNAERPIVIPFTLRFDHVLLDARVNGLPVTLALDTGSGACGLDADWAGALGLAPERTADAVGTASTRISLAMIESVRIGDAVELRNERAALVPLADVSARHGRTIHGTIGYPLFARYVVEIDYAARVLRLYEPDLFVGGDRGEAIPIDLPMRVPIVDAELTGRDGALFDARLILDIGTGGYGSVLTKPFADRHAASLASGPCLERTIGTGVGGAMRGSVASPAALRVGGLRVDQPVVAMPASAQGFFGVTWADGTLGAPILRRTRLTLDYAHKRVYMTAEESFGEPYRHDLSGLWLCATAADTGDIVIADVAPGSAGDTAGLANEDVLVAVGGQPAGAASIESIATLLMRAGDYPVRFRRGGEIRETVLRLEPSALREGPGPRLADSVY